MAPSTSPAPTFSVWPSPFALCVEEEGCKVAVASLDDACIACMHAFMLCVVTASPSPLCDTVLRHNYSFPARAQEPK